ncbi:MAG: SIMPL domain-containing protein [Candidatus Roizmanbacteria bacterium]
MLPKEISFKQTSFLAIALVGIIVIGNIIGSYIVATRPVYVQQNSGVDGRPVNNVSVTATGKVSVVPDIVTFTAGYNVTKPDIVSVQKDLNEKNNAILTALRGKSILDKDIQTYSFDISPKYRYEPTTGKQLTDGFMGSLRIFVKVRNKEQAGEIVDTVVTSGATTIDAIQFTLDNPEKMRSEARKLAGESAKKKAVELASASGVSLGSLIAISESVDYSPQPMVANMMKTFASEGSAIQSAPVPEISGGSLEISITVNATYGIK